MALNGAILGGAASFKWNGSLRWYDSDESAYAGIKATATITGSVDYALPAAPPVSDGYVLSSTTAGVMSWSAGGSGTVTGTGADNRIAVWSGAGSLDSDVNFQYDSSITAMSIGDVPSSNISLFVSRTGATTVVSEALDVSNTNTSSTASINKYGLAIASTGTWNGAGAINYGLFISGVSGGTTNWAIYNNTATNVYLGTGLTGINADVPGAYLHVMGDAGTEVAAVGGVGAWFQRSATAGANSYIGVVSGTSGAAGLLLGDTADQDIGMVWYDNATDAMALRTNNTDRLTISSAGVVNIANLTASKPVFTDGSKNLVSGENITATSGSTWITGTTYALTTSLAVINTGANDLSVNLPAAGTYLLQAYVDLLTGSTAGDHYSFDMYNSTDGSFLTDFPHHDRHEPANSYADFTFFTIYTVAGAKTIQVRGKNATAARGSVASGSYFTFIRLN